MRPLLLLALAACSASSDSTARCYIGVDGPCTRTLCNLAQVTECPQANTCHYCPTEQTYLDLCEIDGVDYRCQSQCPDPSGRSLPPPCAPPLGPPP